MVVVDRDPLGVGASTRNGGMVIPELKAGPAGLTAKYGPVGRRMYDEVNEAFDQVETLVADEGIDCDYARSGQLYLAHNRAHVPALAAMADEQGGDLGEAVHYVRRDDLDEEIGSNAFHAGVVHRAHRRHPPGPVPRRTGPARPRGRSRHPRPHHGDRARGEGPGPHPRLHAHHRPGRGRGP